VKPRIILGFGLRFEVSILTFLVLPRRKRRKNSNIISKIELIIQTFSVTAKSEKIGFRKLE